MRERMRASESSKEKLFCGPFEVLYDEMKRWLIESGWLKFLPSLVDLSYGLRSISRFCEVSTRRDYDG